jgi:WD40 repeat protein
VVAVLEGHTDWVRGVAWSPDGSRLASASNDQTVRVWDPTAGSAVSVLCLDEPVHAIIWVDRGISVGYSNRVGVFEFRGGVR